MEHDEAAGQPSAHPGEDESPETEAVESAGPAAAPDDAGRAMPPPPETGDARVDDTMRGLHDLGDRPPDEHVEAYEQVHAGLQETLADLDKRAEDEAEGG